MLNVKFVMLFVSNGGDNLYYQLNFSQVILNLILRTIDYPPTYPVPINRKSSKIS